MSSDMQQEESSPWQTAKALGAQSASDNDRPLNRLGPAIPLSDLHGEAAPAGVRQFALTPDLMQLLDSLPSDRQPHQLQSQSENVLPAPRPILMKRAPVIGSARGTFAR